MTPVPWLHHHILKQLTVCDVIGEGVYGGGGSAGTFGLGRAKGPGIDELKKKQDN